MTEHDAAVARRTPFDSLLRRNGAQFMEWEGWEWSAHFGDAEAEHHAVRTGVGVWDESPLQKCEVSGPGATRAVNRMFTANMTSMRPGQVRYAPFCDTDGRMVGDGTAFKFADDKWWVMATLASDAAHLASVAADVDDAVFTEITESLPHLQVQGPRSTALLQALGGAGLPSLPFFRFSPEPVRIAGAECWLSRTGYSGELGYELFVRPDDAEKLWLGLVENGARPYGVTAIETLRIEASLLLCGVDFVAHESNPFEVGLERLIQIDESDCVGRHGLFGLREAATRRFTSLVFDGDAVPENGAIVRGLDGAELGVATSHCLSPMLQRGVGLAVLDRSAAAHGTRVLVGDSDLLATVLVGPVYDPTRRRARGG